MKVEKDLQRIKWRFTQGKEFIPNQNDIDAYNGIATYVQEKQKQQIVDNVLFTKLYIYLLGEFLTHYKTTVDSPIPQKEISRILGTKMGLLIEQFREKASNQELNLIKTVDEMENYEQLTFQECVDNLKIMTTEALNTFSPNHLDRV